jgi:hypothetical protein
MTVKGIRYLLTAAIPLGLVACTVSPASNPTVSQAKVVGIASNMPAGRANKIIVGTTVFTNESSVVSVPGLNLVDGIASQLRPGLSLRQIPFPPQKKGFAGAMAAAYSPIPAKVPPRTDCDLILLLDGSTLNASGGYYNAAAGAYIPSYSNRRGLFMQEGFLLGAKVDRSAGCEFTVIIFDAKTGSRIDYALISEFEKVPKDQSLPAALLRTAAKAATRAANAAGLSSRSTAGSKAKKEPSLADANAQFKTDMKAANKEFADGMAQIKADMKSNFKTSSKMLEYSKKNLRKSFGVKDPTPAPATSPETTAP